jgi:hypothetical protein
MHSIQWFRALPAVLLVLFLSFAVPVALALTDCVWSTDECLTAVYQYESYWTMYITCTDGSGGTWTGSGQWGGICPE